MNVSKLIDEDEPLFLSLLDDMFPGIKLSVSVYKDLQKAITNVLNEMQLMNHAEFNLKVVQLYETSLVRHGLMVLGPTGAGKTKCIHCLMKSMTECGRPHKEMRMNPKVKYSCSLFFSFLQGNCLSFSFFLLTSSYFFLLPTSPYFFLLFPTSSYFSYFFLLPTHPTSSYFILPPSYILLISFLFFLPLFFFFSLLPFHQYFWKFLGHNSSSNVWKIGCSHQRLD